MTLLCPQWMISFWSFLVLLLFNKDIYFLLLPIYWLHYLMSNYTEVNRADCINRRAWLVSWSLFNLSREFRLWIYTNGDNDAQLNRGLFLQALIFFKGKCDIWKNDPLSFSALIKRRLYAFLNFTRN